MLTEQESKIKRSDYEDMQDPLRLLMTQPQEMPSKGLAKAKAFEFLVQEEETALEVKNYAAAETLLDVQRYYADILKDLSQKYFGHYRTEKSWEKRDSLKTTHQMITEQALCILNKDDLPKKDQLVYESSGPDDAPETIKFVMEGHFCGIISDGIVGNFLQKYMPPLVFDLLYNFGDFKDHLKETALSNIGKYSAKYLNNGEDIKYLAWTLHFLQDITAPHHAGNIPAIIPSLITDINGGNDTHSAFEEFANNFMKEQPDKFNDDAKNLLQHLRGFPLNLSKPNELEEFGKMILQKSLKNIDGVLRTKDQNLWKETISKAMPLAIAATAAVLEKMRMPA